MEICLSVCLSICLSMALQPFVGPWPLFQFLDLFTQLIGLLGWGISPSQICYLQTEQHKHRIKADRHPCLQCDSNPRFQCSSSRKRFMLRTARPLWLARAGDYFAEKFRRDSEEHPVRGRNTVFRLNSYECEQDSCIINNYYSRKVKGKF
jgi:hypothetical protein